MRLRKGQTYWTLTELDLDDYGLISNYQIIKVEYVSKAHTKYYHRVKILSEVKENIFGTKKEDIITVYKSSLFETEHEANLELDSFMEY